MRDHLTVTCTLFDSPEENHGWVGWGLYDPTWVDKLYRGVRRNLDPTTELRFVCITEYPDSAFQEPVEAVPFAYKEHIGRWMCINEVFRPDLNLGRTLVMGLDTIIMGSLDDIAAYDGPMAMTRAREGKHEACNAVVSYTGETGAQLWEEYIADPDGVSAAHVTPWSRGQGSEMVYWRERGEAWLNGGRHLLDDFYPGQLCSWKLQGKKDLATLADCRVLYFHGHTKPCRDDVPPEIREHWR